jgi:putative MATE family efflux protein
VLTRTRALAAEEGGRELLSLAWPILCSEVLALLDTSVNMMWVGRELGDVGVAALSNANLLWMLLSAGAFGLSMGGAVRIGRSLGGGDVRGAKAALGTVTSASVILSIACALPMIVWARALVDCLGTPEPSALQAVAYLRPLLLSVPFTYLSGVIVAALQAAGDSRKGFYLSVACVGMDAALNPIFIGGLGPLSPLGIAGSALSTLISQAVGLAGLLCMLYGSDHALCLHRPDLGLLRVGRKHALDFLFQGGPMAALVLWGSLEEILMISLVNRFGTDTTAAYGATIQLWNFILMPAAALGLATTVIVARNIGAGRWDQVRKTTRLGLTCGVLATGALVVLVEGLGRWAYEVFLPAGSPALAVAQEINRDATWSLVFLGAYAVWVGALRAMGAVWMPLGISASILAVRFPVTATVAGRTRPGAIWWSFPASAIITAGLAALGYFGLVRRHVNYET